MVGRPRAERRGFRDRAEGGQRLAERLKHLAGTSDVLVVGLPRGGVPVAYEVAAALSAPLDVIVVRKLGVPFQPELGMGAIGEDDVRVVNDLIVQAAHVTPEELAGVEARERVELERRAQRFRRGRRRLPLAGRTVIVVDDGIATGSTARAACLVARAAGAVRVVLAVPVAPTDWTERLAEVADEYVTVSTPADFFAVGQFYRNFRQTSDDEVVQLLDRAAARYASTAPTVENGPPVRDDDVEVVFGPTRLAGHLTVPAAPLGLVLFAHGSGSSRHSPRNRSVASALNEAGLATLLLDLLTAREELDRSNVFDVDLLAERLVGATEWAAGQPEVAGLRVGYFGASTGAAAALAAAARSGDAVSAVVSRGGRPDLAGDRLVAVTAPTLLIVGGRDEVVLDLNRRARARLAGESELRVVPDATHLFEEPGALELVTDLARDWFTLYLPPTVPHGARPGL